MTRIGESPVDMPPPGSLPLPEIAIGLQFSIPEDYSELLSIFQKLDEIEQQRFTQACVYYRTALNILLMNGMRKISVVYLLLIISIECMAQLPEFAVEPTWEHVSDHKWREKLFSEVQLDLPTRKKIKDKLIKKVNRAKERFKFFMKYLPDYLYETGEIKRRDRIYKQELENLFENIYASRSRFVHVAKDFFMFHPPYMDIIRGEKQLNPKFDPKKPESKTNKKYKEFPTIPSVYWFAKAVSACLAEYLRSK